MSGSIDTQEAASAKRAGLPGWAIAVIVGVVVLALMGACGFAALVYVGFQAGRTDAQRTACFTNERNTEMAAETYYVEEQRDPLDLDAMVASGHLEAIPSCPAGGTYSLGPDRTVTCSVHGHWN